MKNHKKFVKEIEKNGLRDTLVYFNRIGDKLFAANSIAIGGYFAFYALSEVSIFCLIIPIINLILLLFVELLMLKKSRFEANYRNEPMLDVEDRYRLYIKRANNSQYFTFFTSAAVYIILFIIIFA